MATRCLGPNTAQVWLAGWALLLLGVGAAFAGDRCEGTLCDFYYDHMAAPSQTPPPSASRQTPAAPAEDSVLGRLFSGGSAPQPQQPGAAPPPAKQPFVAVQGGGLIGMMHGDAPQRCTGTLCDLYYGGPPPEEPAARAAPAATPAEEPTTEDAPAPSRVRAAPRAERPTCTASTRDPWQCYR